MRRKLMVLLLIIVCFVLQNTVFQALALASVSPNLLLVVTASLGLMRGEKEGLLTGFFCGMLMDIFYGRILGFYALIYLFIGYGNGIFHRLYLDEDIKLPMVWIAFSDLAYGLLLYFFLFMFRGRFDFVYYLIHIIIPELIYTVVVTLGLYWLIRRINQWLEKHEEDLPVTEEI
ncbi:MAG: rod shape-determining protein MreD [Lachnospiraceae bacterium]|jgi:rod shape-determining protein MreD|nr:rod shape-determining protein MreD [Lachnospiraceae bacterium]MCI9134431.1 rod shape-determining protein MreD [Lachnospiraceae bacterium]